MKMVKKNEGITVVSLVITIIALLILAGVTIGLVFNSDGLFQKAETATSRYSQKQAEEALTLTLENAQMIKYSEGLTEQKLDEMLNKVGKVDETSNNLVTVDKYIFLIDRNVPKIVKSMGFTSESGAVNGGSLGENQGGNNEENDNTLNNKITITIPTEGKILKFGASEISSGLNINQYDYSITPTEGIPNDKVTGTFNKNEIVEINSTKRGETYTITITAINEKGNKIAIANAKMKIPDLPEIGEEVPEAGWTVEEAKGLVARDGLKAHLGEKVQYNPKASGTWRIFYFDSENDGNGNGYFGKLNTLYLKRDNISNDIGLTDYISHVPSDNGVIMKKLNPKWAVASNGNEIDIVNEHCTAWLCDPAVWNSDYKVEGIAEYAIGSPSVEMYMKAFNIYKDNNANSTTLINEIGNTYGYNLGTYGSYTWNGSNVTHTGQKSIEAGPNNIFMTEGNCYWLASPSSDDKTRIIRVHGINALVNFSKYNATNSVCPIVAIK